MRLFPCAALLLLAFPALSQTAVQDLGGQIRSVRLAGTRVSEAEQRTIAEAVLLSLNESLADPAYAKEAETRIVLADASEQVRREYQHRGYIKVDVGEAAIKRGPDGIVDLEFPVQEGDIYRLGDLVFRGVTVFPAEELRPLFRMKLGDILNTEHIQAGLTQMRSMYGARGYIDVFTIPDIQFREETHTASLLLHVTEGKAYRFDDLILDKIKLDAGARARLLSNWTKLRGRPAHREQLKEFHAEIRHLLPVAVSADEWFVWSQNDTEGTVDIEIVPADQLPPRPKSRCRPAGRRASQ